MRQSREAPRRDLHAHVQILSPRRCLGCWGSRLGVYNLQAGSILIAACILGRSIYSTDLYQMLVCDD